MQATDLKDFLRCEGYLIGVNYRATDSYKGSISAKEVAKATIKGSNRGGSNHEYRLIRWFQSTLPLKLFIIACKWKDRIFTL